MNWIVLCNKFIKLTVKVQSGDDENFDALRIIVIINMPFKKVLELFLNLIAYIFDILRQIYFCDTK